MKIGQLSNTLKIAAGITSLVVTCSLTSCAVPTTSSSPRNVVLFIGDGMDDHQVTIARNYLVGAKGRLTLDTMAVRSSSQVLTADEQHPEHALYVADSANSAISMATGVITSRGRIATTAKTDNKITTIVELAESAGLRTGLVSTAAITDATPASFVAHINQRGCQSPDEMVNSIGFGGIASDCSQYLKRNGGQGSIAEQLADSDVDVLLGGGLKYFQENIESAISNRTVNQQAEENGYQLITSKSRLKDINPQKKLLGLFSPGTMPVKLIGEADREGRKVALTADGEVDLPTPFSCVPNPAFDGIPTLSEMTQTALSHLAHDNSNGFFFDGGVRFHRQAVPPAPPLRSYRRDAATQRSSGQRSGVCRPTPQHSGAGHRR